MAAFDAIASSPIASLPSPVDLFPTVTETSGATDAQVATFTAAASVSESCTATDTLLEFEVITESASASDAATCALTRVGALSERAGARESVLNATAVYPVFILTAAAASATDTVSLPVWTDNSDDTQTWTTNTPSGSVWTSNSHAESTWTEN